MLKDWQIQIFNRVIVIGMFLIIGLGISNFSLLVSADSNFADSPEIFINSRFKLWDENEKMLDKNFSITIIFLNESLNNSFEYSIKIDNNNINGSNEKSVTEYFDMNNTNIILILQIFVNNEIIFEAENIILTSGVNQNTINTGLSPYVISLNPSDWKSLERNIFISAIIGGLFSILISYRLVKRIRKSHGVKTIR